MLVITNIGRQAGLIRLTYNQIFNYKERKLKHGQSKQGFQNSHWIKCLQYGISNSNINGTDTENHPSN